MSTDAAARAAYRIGLIDAMLHEDTVKALNPPGIILESLRGERAYRLQELAEQGVTENDLEDMLLEANDTETT